MTERPRHLSPTTVIACLALFFAIAGGSAIALKGRNTVDSGDIKKGQVKTSDIANNAVTTRKIKNGGVRRVDLAPDEPFHKIGTPNNPQFLTGGENDCIWSKLTQPAPLNDVFNPPSFYKDNHGVVRMTGGVVATDGPGGDANCNDLQDAYAFTLPPAYRPTKAMFFQTTATSSFLIVGTQDVVVATGTVPAGTVLNNSPGNVALVFDGVNFRAAGTGTGLPRQSGPVRIGPKLAKLLGLN